MQNTQLLFTSFINEITTKQIHLRAFKRIYLNLEINLKDLGKISIPQIINIRAILLKKISTDVDLAKRIEEQWFQAERKIYNWLLFCYLELHNKSILDVNDQDYAFLSTITTNKSIRLIKFQTLHLFKQPCRPKWTQQEDSILYSILQKEKKFETQGQWGQISKQLFMRGKQQAIKVGKHCRQRWLNHLNPTLSKQWSHEQDMRMMGFIRDEGKKWSCLVKQFKNTKNEHMIKNRFYSLIKKAKKKQNNQEITQQEIIEIIIKTNINISSQQKIIQNHIIVPQKKVAQKQLPIIQQYNFSLVECECENKNVDFGDEIKNVNDEETKKKSKIKLMTSMSIQRQLNTTKQQKGDEQIFTNALSVTAESVLFSNKEFINQLQSSTRSDMPVDDPFKISRSIPYSTPFSASPYPPTPTNELFNLSFIRQEQPIRSFHFNLFDYVKKQTK